MLDSGERVHLIGVDTAESVDPRRPVEYFGKEAPAFPWEILARSAPTELPLKDGGDRRAAAKSDHNRRLMY